MINLKIEYKLGKLFIDGKEVSDLEIEIIPTRQVEYECKQFTKQLINQGEINGTFKLSSSGIDLTKNMINEFKETLMFELESIMYAYAQVGESPFKITLIIEVIEKMKEKGRTKDRMPYFLKQSIYDYVRTGDKFSIRSFEQYLIEEYLN